MCACVCVLQRTDEFQQRPYLHHIYQPEQPFLLSSKQSEGLPGGLPVIKAGGRRKQTTYQTSESSQPIWTERQRMIQCLAQPSQSGVTSALKCENKEGTVSANRFSSSFCTMTPDLTSTSGRTSGAGRRFYSNKRRTVRKQWSYPCRAQRGVGHTAGRGRGQRVRVRHHGQRVLLEGRSAARALSCFQSLNFSSQDQRVKVLQVLRGDQASHLRKQGELERERKGWTTSEEKTRCCRWRSKSHGFI